MINLIIKIHLHIYVCNSAIPLEQGVAESRWFGLWLSKPNMFIYLGFPEGHMFFEKLKTDIQQCKRTIYFGEIQTAHNNN